MLQTQLRLIPRGYSITEVIGLIALWILQFDTSFIDYHLNAADWWPISLSFPTLADALYLHQPVIVFFGRYRRLSDHLLTFWLYIIVVEWSLDHDMAQFRNNFCDISITTLALWPWVLFFVSGSPISEEQKWLLRTFWFTFVMHSVSIFLINRFKTFWSCNQSVIRVPIYRYNRYFLNFSVQLFRYNSFSLSYFLSVTTAFSFVFWFPGFFILLFGVFAYSLAGMASRRPASSHGLRNGWTSSGDHRHGSCQPFPFSVVKCIEQYRNMLNVRLFSAMHLPGNTHRICNGRRGRPVHTTVSAQIIWWWHCGGRRATDCLCQYMHTDRPYVSCFKEFGYAPGLCEIMRRLRSMTCLVWLKIPGK